VPGGAEGQSAGGRYGGSCIVAGLRGAVRHGPMVEASARR
jgi:hypothetical protein